MSETTCSSCTSTSCSAAQQRSDETEAQWHERQMLMSRVCQIKRKIVVLSGKGGVGKSTVAVNVALALSLAGERVGLLDVDVHGPSVPRLLGLQGKQLDNQHDSIRPVGYENLKVMSIGFLLDEDTPAIWRGPAKYGVIKQFLANVDWGPLDTLVVDCPPGTGDEPLSVIQLLEDVDGAVVVTTPQALAIADVRKSIAFCRRLDVPVIGVLENMSGFICPHCNEQVDVFSSGGGETMARELDVPFLGRIPLDPAIVHAGDEGKPFAYFRSKTEAGKAFNAAVEKLLPVNPSTESEKS